MKRNQPFFSIIIPTYNRPELLSACLSSLAQQDYPADRFEVIVVDDGSRISPNAVVKQFQMRLNAKLLTQSHAGPATARNQGAAYAGGKYLAFTDDDCAPQADWLQNLEARFKEIPDHAIGGPHMNTVEGNPYSAASHLLLDYLYTHYNTGTHRTRFLTTSNVAFPREPFLGIEGFDPTFPYAGGEDREVCDRWLSRGYAFTFAPEVVVYHSHTLTFCTFLGQHFNYGRGAFHFHQAHVRRAKAGVQVEPLSFYLNLLRYPFTQHLTHPAWLLAASLALSQGANAAGFFWEKLKFLNDSYSEPPL